MHGAENALRALRIRPVRVGKKTVAIGIEILDRLRERIRHDVHRQRRRIEAALHLAADQPVQSQLREYGNIAPQDRSQSQTAEIAVNIPHQMIIEVETVARKASFPSPQKAEIDGYIVRICDFVAAVRERLARDSLQAFVVRFAVRAENGSEHHDKAALIANFFPLGRPIHVEINQKSDLRRQPCRRQCRIDFVQQLNI